MKNVNIGNNTAGIQKVVFENVIDVLAGGVHIQPASAIRYASDDPKVIPAGTLIGRKEADGTHKVVAITAGATEDDDATFDVTPLGLTHFDVLLDDMPLAPVVLSGTVRVEALPDLEGSTWESIAKVLPRITFLGTYTAPETP